MRKVLEINNPSEEEMSTEPKKIVHDNPHAYEYTTTRNYDRKIGTTETNYQHGTYQSTQSFQQDIPELSIDAIQRLHNTELWLH